jgi:hypothetical protein
MRSRRPVACIRLRPLSSMPYGLVEKHSPWRELTLPPGPWLCSCGRPYLDSSPHQPLLLLRLARRNRTTRTQPSAPEVSAGLSDRRGGEGSLWHARLRELRFGEAHGEAQARRHRMASGVWAGPVARVLRRHRRRRPHRRQSARHAHDRRARACASLALASHALHGEYPARLIRCSLLCSCGRPYLEQSQRDL